jgi:hypothetical protein
LSIQFYLMKHVTAINTVSRSGVEIWLKTPVICGWGAVFLGSYDFRSRMDDGKSPGLDCPCLILVLAFVCLT